VVSSTLTTNNSSAIALNEAASGDVLMTNEIPVVTGGI